jgi:non-heme chloroperoxidase
MAGEIPMPCEPRAPHRDSMRQASKLVKGAQLTVYKDLPHGMASTHHDATNADLLAFFKA